EPGCVAVTVPAEFLTLTSKSSPACSTLTVLGVMYEEVPQAGLGDGQSQPSGTHPPSAGGAGGGVVVGGRTPPPPWTSSFMVCLSVAKARLSGGIIRRNQKPRYDSGGIEG